jgi:hypothetical protein
VQNKEQCYYVTVRKSYDITYQVYAYSFEQALVDWDEHGVDLDTEPVDSTILSVRVD